MSGTIDNANGSITITESAIAMIAGRAALENYGLVGMTAKSASEGLLGIISFITGDSKKKGVKITDVDANTFDIDLYVKLIYGLSMSAIAQNIISHVKYRVETMTGLFVRDINIHVEDIWVESSDI